MPARQKWEGKCPQLEMRFSRDDPVRRGNQLRRPDFPQISVLRSLAQTWKATGTLGPLDRCPKPIESAKEGSSSQSGPRRSVRTLWKTIERDLIAFAIETYQRSKCPNSRDVRDRRLQRFTAGVSHGARRCRTSQVRLSRFKYILG